MSGTNVKITINGQEYGSLDEVPEEMRHLIQDRIATAMASRVPGVQHSVTKVTLIKKSDDVSFKKITADGNDYSRLEDVPEPMRHLIQNSVAAATTGDLGFALRPQLLTPAEYRRQIESQQSGRAPEAFQGEWELGIALCAVIALCAAGLATGYSIPVLFFTIAFSTLGLIGLWYRRQNRALYPVLVELANRIQGAFVVVIGGRGKLFFAREAWHGSAGFDPGSKYRPSHSRIDAQIGPSSVQLEIHSRSVLARLGNVLVAAPAPTGDAAFDRHFAVACRDAAFVAKFLDDYVRAALERLRRFGDLSVSVHGNLVRVNLHRDLATMHGRLRRDRDEDILERFLTDACAVVDAAAVRSR